MEMSMLLIGLSALCIFGFLYASVNVICGFIKRKSLILSAQGKKFSLASLWVLTLRDGVKTTIPLTQWLLKNRQIRKFASELTFMSVRRGWPTTPQSVLSVFLVILGAVGLVAFLLTGNLIGSMASGICLVAITAVMAGSARDQQIESMREEIPAVLELMAACFGSGFTLLQTFQQIAHEIPGSLGKLFARSAHVLETGGTVDEALNGLRDESNISELTFVIVALEVQHQSGGALKQVLSTASESVKGELSLKRSLRVQTAQSKLSARVVIVMPFILIAIFSLVSPDFLTPFFSSIAGYALLGLALLMQVTGIYLVHKALAVDGVS